MSAIAYISDAKLLELHRLNAHKTMNFWRLSTKTTFSDFGIGDLVFFLSKNREHMKKKEKGIVGFGRLTNIYTYAPRTMWNRFGKKNGYNSYEEFREAIEKVAKDHVLPKKISSFYLENVIFFQSPVYLSELGMKISSQVESYVYIRPEESVIDLLEYGKSALDIWSGNEDLEKIIDNEELEYALKLSHKEIGDIRLPDRKRPAAMRVMKRIKEKNPGCDFIGSSKLDLCLVNDRDILIVLYNSKDIDTRLLIGQSQLYRKYIKKYYRNPFRIYFKTSDNNKEVNELINSL